MFIPVLRIRDVYPGSSFLPILDPETLIPDPKTAGKVRGEQKIVIQLCQICAYKIGME
jgi:hypothetical protein